MAQVYFRSKWHFRPSSRWATIDMNRKLGAVPLLGGAATPSNTTSPGPRPTSMPSGILVYPAAWPQRILVANWGLCRFRGTAPNLRPQCRVGRGLPRTKWHLDPCSRLATVDVCQKLGAPLLSGEGAGSPSNTKSPGLWPTSIPSGILMHPAVWSQ